MSANEFTLVKGLAEDIEAGQMAFMFGAGISVRRRSHCPGWLEMVKAILKETAGPSFADGLDAVIEPHAGLLFNEVFFQMVDRVLSREQATGVIKACLGTTNYSNIHRFVASLIDNSDVQVLTTNFDELIEAALGDLISVGDTKQDRLNRLLKLHGTLSKPNTARFTANSVFAPLSKDLAEKARVMIRGRTLLVAGYGGMDEFDVMPILFDRRLGHKVIWVYHPGNPPEESVRKRHFGEVQTQEVEFDIDVLLSKVFLELSIEKRSDPVLNHWQAKPEICEDREWWRNRLAEWAREVRQIFPAKIQFLWARFAEHLGLTKVSMGGSWRNLVEEAYQAIGTGDGMDCVMEHEVRARIAYMYRTRGDSEKAAEELGKISVAIQQAISLSQIPAEKKGLQELFGWTVHQHGVALQGSKEYYKAKEKFEEAMQYRQTIGDPQLPYSVFQHFRSATVARDVKGIGIDVLAQPGWRDSLGKTLEQCAADFRARYDIDHFAATKHNEAFVCECLAQENENAEQLSEAISLYQLAMDYRLRLRDPRMIAQSKTRLAVCQTALATQLQRAGSASKEEIQSQLNSAEQHANDVLKIYAMVPQEQFRKDDITKVLGDIKQLRANAGIA